MSIIRSEIGSSVAPFVLEAFVTRKLYDGTAIVVLLKVGVVARFLHAKNAKDDEVTSEAPYMVDVTFSKVLAGWIVKSFSPWSK